MSARGSHEDDLDEIIARLDAGSERVHLHAALQTLSDAQRRAVDGRVIRELDYDQLGSELDCTPPNARARVSRGLRALNTILKGEHP